MISRITPLLIALMMLAGLIWSLPSLAANEPQTQEGTVVSTSGNQLVMTDLAGKQRTHSITEQTKITVNGKPGVLTDLQMSMRIAVMTEEGKVLSVTTIDRHKLPAF